MKKIDVNSGEITLDFAKNIHKNDVNYIWYYNKESKRYCYRFTIDNAQCSSSKYFKHKTLKKIKLSNYKNNRVRLVIENSKKLALTFKNKKNSLVVVFDKKSSKQKSVSKEKVKFYSAATVDYGSKTIVLDPGHGGKDSGAVGYRKYREKVVVLQVAKKLESILKQSGYKVYMTRSNDTFIKLRNRTRFANRKNADLFISIHANSIPKSSNVNKTYGIESYFLSTARSSRAKNVAASENSRDVKDLDYYGKQNFLSIMNNEKIIASHKLAIDLQRSIMSQMRKKYHKIKDGGVREGPFWVLVGAQMPAVLVEIGFISNPMEAKRMTDRVYQSYLAQGLADGIERYFQKNN